MRDVPTTLRRRWYLTVVSVLATVGICLVAAIAFPPTYEAKATIILLPPKTTVDEGENPFLQLSNLSQAVDVMIRTLMSQGAVDAAAQAAPTGTYEVLPDYATNGPIFIVTADDKTPQSTLTTLKIVSDMVAPYLATLQSNLGIAPGSQITSTVLTSDSTVSTVRKTQIRVLILAAAVGIAVFTLLIAMIDSFLTRRLARKERLSNSELTGDNMPVRVTIAGDHSAESVVGRSRRIARASPPRSIAGRDVVGGQVEPTRSRRAR